MLVAITVWAAGSGCLPPPAAESTDPARPADPGPQELVPALPGVGKQGQIVGDGGGPLTTPAAALFKTQQKVVFEIQIRQALQLYQAEHGHYPKTHDEFMERIIQFNRIQLPELPAGHEYVYDPEQGQLMVRRPVDWQPGQ
jgi:hypothetical protein